MRPMCTACHQRVVAVNYCRNNVTHYRTKCDHCIRRHNKIKSPKPRWQLDGYKKKPTCDRCGFKARYSSQLLVCHLDGNLNHSNLRNLRTVCLNCVEELQRLDIPWVPSQLQADR